MYIIIGGVIIFTLILVMRDEVARMERKERIKDWLERK